MATLTPEQAKQLSDALVDAFDPTTLPWVVRSSLGSQLYAIVNTAQALELVVAELLTWIERRGPGALEAFLHGASSARPNHQKLRQFCQQYFPKTLLELDSSSLIESFNLGLQLLIDMKNLPTVQQTVGRFRADIEMTSWQIRMLKQYKVLHDSLHGLQLTLSNIEGVIARSATNPDALPGLGKIAIPLAQWARESRKQIGNLPSRTVEEDWLDDFESCIRDINVSADQDATPADRVAVAGVAERLRRILVDNPSRINGALVSAAANLRLESIIRTMKEIADDLHGFAAPQDGVLQLFESSTSVGVLRARVDGLVGEHNDWQVFSRQLETAETRSDHQPQARVPKWPQFKSKLDGLCATYPEADWSQDLSKRMAKWISDTPSAQPNDKERTAGEIAFGGFHTACVYRFFEVDKELNELSGQVTEVTQPVDMLLAMIR
jgi:hypothetical protein